MPQYNPKICYSVGWKGPAKGSGIPVITNLAINDMFIHMMFGRVTAKDGTTYEFDTKYNQGNKTLELTIPSQYIDAITNISVGPSMRKFLDWVTDKQGIIDGLQGLGFTQEQADARYVVNTDVRLTDARIPLLHTHTPTQIDGLFSGGKIAQEFIPLIAITNIYVVASQEQRDNLIVQTGDVVIRTDLNENYIYNGIQWVKLLIPPDLIQSVNGHIGSVNLIYSDVGAAPITHAVNHSSSGIDPLTISASQISSIISCVGININANSSTITQGIKGSTIVPFNAIIASWQVNTDQINGSLSFNIRSSASSSYISPAPLITESPINVTGKYGSGDASVFTVLNISQGDILEFEVTACTVNTKAKISIFLKPR